METLPAPTLADLVDPAPPPGPGDWNSDGCLYLPGLIPDDLIDAYEAEWADNNGLRRLRPVDGSDVCVIEADRPGGYNETAYMVHPALMAICTYGPLADALEMLMGEPAGVHLNLSGWVSTERNFHQDTYLNPDAVGDYYAAVWIALGDVHPDSGPFQYIPGSHLWHRLVRSKFEPYLDMRDPEWPKHSEDILTPLVLAEMDERGGELIGYLPKRGDVLIWHSRLYHRGSTAKVPGAYRPALIAHFSGINHRPDFPAPAVKHPEHGGYYFPFHQQADLSHAARMKRGTAV